jgi:hypothetical protein
MARQTVTLPARPLILLQAPSQPSMPFALRQNSGGGTVATRNSSWETECLSTRQTTRRDSRTADMIAPDGTRYGNRMSFLRLEAPALIEVDHGSDQATHQRFECC